MLVVTVMWLGFNPLRGPVLYGEASPEVLQRGIIVLRTYVVLPSVKAAKGVTFISPNLEARARAFGEGGYADCR
jgi:hypothetical protein